MRPENWKNPFEPQEYTDDGVKKKFRQDGRREDFEAGADALWEALKSDGFYIRTGDILEIGGQRIKATKNQILILIPDEETE